MDDAHTPPVLIHACYCGNEHHVFDQNLLASTTVYLKNCVLKKDDKSTDVMLRDAARCYIVESNRPYNLHL